MAKKRRNRSLPKRIAGVRVPKGIRRFADTEIGGSLIADVVFAAFAGAAANPRLRSAVSQLRQNVMSVAAEAMSSISDDADAKSGRKARRNAEQIA